MRLGAYVCVCTGSGDCRRRPARRAVAEDGGEIYRTIKTIGRGYVREREEEEGNRVLTRSFSSRTRGMTRREKKSGVLSVPTARDRTRGRAAGRIRQRERRQARRGRYDRARAPAGAAAAAIEREGEESEAASCSLARQSVPTAAQHTSTFSRLSFPFFTTAPPSARTTAPRRTPRAASSFLFFSGPRVLLFRSPFLP